ncbi:MAG: alpha-ketoacid dehydrogenase subunit beta [Lachnospiraceae bacterium]|jgi:pyruvate dehydrogenase E1 component beta subunit|nr:alpha-ketoacid dehydrogenase subunit beta [Lachnospiraceae bacterium]
MSTPNEITYAQAVRDAMREEMLRDPDVFLMGEDIGVYRGAFGVTQELYKEFPDRVIDTPISEAGFVGCAIGAAVEGMRPIVEIMFSDFISVCYDMILNQAPKMHFMFGGKVSVPLVIRTASGCGTGAAAQHSQSLEAMLCHIPGLKVIVPSTPYDAKGLLKAAVRDNNPVMFLEQKLLYRTTGAVPEGEYTVPIGKADVKRTGSDCTIVTYGRMVHICLKAAETLAGEGISVEVIDLRTLLPMDKQCIIDSVKKTKHLVIVHEAVKTGGLGGEIAASIAESDAFYYLDGPIRRLAAEDSPVPFSAVLEKGVLPDEEKIIRCIREEVG